MLQSPEPLIQDAWSIQYTVYIVCSSFKRLIRRFKKKDDSESSLLSLHPSNGIHPMVKESRRLGVDLFEEALVIL